MSKARWSPAWDRQTKPALYVSVPRPAVETPPPCRETFPIGIRRATALEFPSKSANQVAEDWVAGDSGESPRLRRPPGRPRMPRGLLRRRTVRVEETPAASF